MAQRPFCLMIRCLGARRRVFGQVDPVHRSNIFIDAWRASENGRQHNNRRRREQGFPLLLVAIGHHTALEEPSRGCHYSVAFGSLFLVAHAKVTARALEIHDILILGAGRVLGRVIVELEA